MMEISIIDFGMYILLAFIVGIIYEATASRYDYKTGKRKR